MLNSVSVKTLAEFIHRRGDLYPALGRRVTGEEGIAAQKRAQQGRGAGYERERSVSAEFERGAITLSVSGRLDGCDLCGPEPLVEEIKATRADPSEVERAVGSAHWAQARLYAALLVVVHPEHARWHVRLLYCHPDTDEQTPFERLEGAASLTGFLDKTIDVYCQWLAGQRAYRDFRNDWLAAREFPYGGFRAHQRALAGRVYQAFRDGEHLLLEAPTGSGKTMGVLFPALKALATGMAERLFYLTSRGTGALAAVKAARDLAAGGQRIRVVELVAKEKACLVEGMPCDERCAYSVGYYDRIQGALESALELRDMDQAAVRSVAESHQVCPFELSLDAALWSDLIIGDYNYLIDPVVRLQRFMNDSGLGVLVDESHQLAERTRDMLSLRLDRAAIRGALAESPPEQLARRLKAVDRALMTVRRGLVTEGGPGAAGAEVVIDAPAGLTRAAQKALDTLAEEELELVAYPLTRQVMFDLSRWLRAEKWTLDEEGNLAAEYRYLACITDGGRGRGQKGLRLNLVCLDPAPYLEAVLGEYGAHVRFSGTVSPLDLYQALHGQADAPSERLESPFAQEQMATLIIKDLPVYYRQREESLPRLAELVRAVTRAHTGNYLVALPSFEYLGQLQAAFSDQSEVDLCAQTPGMSEAARIEFLDGFKADGQTRVGLIVLGGVFAESVDFSHAPLAGVICVGVGLPPTSTQKEEMRDHYDSRLGTGAGETVAYQQPAMTKVLQMAGRLLRGPQDRGVLCLVDDRFARTDYQRFFPRHWRPIPVNAAQAVAHLENFWQETSAVPRLRTSIPQAPQTTRQ